MTAKVFEFQENTMRIVTDHLLPLLAAATTSSILLSVAIA